ncbi:facilitated trehalose transporter Tret1-like [Copidosoma floridanum]|uniref:facilitated trehalose transporter Tret1-like n=1 Tax=Copidosoma floridanum TaxID=29053 RepID=UPI0006C96ABE|nr:facilitated trehalose transporter Tret1-like [Copidosoma floridanum]
MESQRSYGTRTLYASVTAACLNGLSVGNLAGWPQAAIPQLLSGSAGGVIFNESEVAWIAGIFFLGMLAGGFVSLAVASNYGKKRLFLLASLPMMLGWSIIAVATTFWEFVFGRVVLGIGGGMLCHQTEMYLSEVSPAKRRSSMSVLFCACIHVGVLLSFGIGPSLSVSSATAVYLAVVLLLVALYLSAVPETPFWLIQQGRSDEALSILRRLRGSRVDVTEEFREIREFVERSELDTKSELDWTAFKRVLSAPAKRRAILLVVLLTTAQQFSGMAAMHSYAQLIFERSASNLLVQGRYVSLLIGSIELCCTLGSGFLVERVNRRSLVGMSTATCCACMLVMGLHFHGLVGDSGVLPVLCVVVFALAYGLGLSTIATVIAAECLSMDARNIGAAAQNTTVCFSIFTITKLWQMITSSYGQEYSFWMAAVVTALHCAVLLSILPETRGKSLVEIQALLAASSNFERSLRTIPLLPVLQSIKIVPAGHIVKNNELRLS